MNLRSRSAARESTRLLEELKGHYGHSPSARKDREDDESDEDDTPVVLSVEPRKKRKRKAPVATLYDRKFREQIKPKGMLKSIIASTSAKIQEIFFKALPFPRVSIRHSGMITTKPPLFVPAAVFKVFYHPNIQDIGVTMTIGRTYWDYKFHSEAAVLRLLRLSDMRAIFRLNQQDPGNLDSMRISSAIVSKERPIVMR